MSVKLTVCGGVLVSLVGFIAPGLDARAEMPSFEDFYEGVTECRLNLARYSGVLGPHQEAVVIALPSARAVNGLLIDSFFFAPGHDGEPERYGLLINAPLDVVGTGIPEFRGQRSVNGHVRDLVPLSDRSREPSAARKTLLLCTGGMAI